MSIDFLKFKNISKIWGSEKIFKLNFIKKNKFNILKVITIKKNQEPSLQFHLKKKEMIIIMKGSGTLKYYSNSTNNKIIKNYKNFEFNINNYKYKIKKIAVGDAFFIDKKTIHQIHSSNEIVLVEISTNYLKDVIRLKDKYGRT